MLFDLDTPCDLACRGFGREEILSLTGVDTGYHTNSLRGETMGINRVAYKREHVSERLDDDAVLDTLARYGRCEIDVAGVLAELGLSNPNVCKLRKIFAGTRFEAAFRDADRAYRRHNMKSGFAAAHDGVDNPFKLAQYQEAAANTREERYGGRYTLAAGSSKADQARATFAEHMADEDFRVDLQAKKSAACMAHYGVEHPMQSDEVKAKAKQTVLERYGDDHWSRTDEGRCRLSESAVRTAGLRVEKSRETCRARYGVDNWSQTEEARSAQSDRMRSSIDARFEKMHATMQRRYGVDWGGQTDFHREQMRKQWSEHRDELVEAIRQGNIEKYGVPYYQQTAEARDAQSRRMLEDAHRRAEVARQTMLERYGVEHWMQVFENAQKAHEVAISNLRNNHGVDYLRQLSERGLSFQDATLGSGLSSTSATELHILECLIVVFGVEDVEWQWSEDSRYPFTCDFYIRSRDLFIELNGTWTHGGHWYREDSEADVALRNTWFDKSMRYYDNAIVNWCSRDVRKRDAAREAALNYVVFWDGGDECSDARLWFAMGCPDGHDWEREYSWLSERHLSLSGRAPKLTGTASNAVKIARWANGEVFYGRELAMWEENAYQKVWGTLQARLYANRYKYLRSGSDGEGLYCGKLPDELSDLEIVRGLGIMGKVRAYSTFDNSAMVDVIGRYGVTSVLDPCAGWGERLATCCGFGLPYLGIDVNERLFTGYGRIIGEYGDAARQRCVCADAAEVSIDGEFDAVITCPPYGSLERYSDVGAENLDDEAFSAWWERVVANMETHVSRLFCVQTNQACKDVFASGLEAHGWRLAESVALNKRSSHMTRKRGGVDLKREFEEMLVFERAHELDTYEAVVG